MLFIHEKDIGSWVNVLKCCGLFVALCSTNTKRKKHKWDNLYATFEK